MERMKEGIRLRESGKLLEANQFFKNLVSEYPDDAQINYQCAWSYDVLGLESEAIPYYKKAIESGLPAADERDAYIGLGSTLRETGAYQESKELLEKAIEKFNSNAMRAFLALSLYNLGENKEAVQLLLRLLLKTTSDQQILAYQKALSVYGDTLPDSFDPI